MAHKTLLSQYLKFISLWEKDRRQTLSFESSSENTVKISEVLELLNHKKIDYQIGVCYGLSILERFLKTQNIVEDRENLDTVILNNPTKMKIFMYCRGKIKQEQPA